MSTIASGPGQAGAPRDPGEVKGGRGRGAVIWSTLRSRPQAAIGATVLLLTILMAIFAPFLAPYGPRRRSARPSPRRRASSCSGSTTAASTCSP